jgi:hypothetical protein
MFPPCLIPYQTHKEDNYRKLKDAAYWNLKETAYQKLKEADYRKLKEPAYWKLKETGRTAGWLVRMRLSRSPHKLRATN